MLRPMTSTSWVGIVLLISTFAGSAEAQRRPTDPCRDATGEDAIAACTRDIASGSFKGAALGERFNNRAIAYDDDGEHDRAEADYAEAITILTRAIGLDPKDARALVTRGLAYSGKRDDDLAIADFNEAIRLDPKYAMAFNSRGLVYHYRALLSKDQSGYDRAIADYTEAIRLDRKFTEAFYNRGIAYIRKRDYDRAIADYTALIRLNPKDARAFGDRSAAYQRKGNYDRAIADFNEAVRLNPELNIGRPSRYPPSWVGCRKQIWNCSRP